MNRNVYKQLAAMEDLAQGQSSRQQKRASSTLQLKEIDVHYAVSSNAEMSAIDVTKYNRARVYTNPTTYVDYIFIAGDFSGIESTGPGSWLELTGDIPSLQGISLSTTNGDVFQLNWNATDLVDNGFELINPRTGIKTVFLPNGDILLSEPNRGIILRNSTDTESYRVTLNEDGTLLTTNINDSEDVVLNRDIPNDVVATNYNLVLSDAGKTVWMNNAAANTLNIPLNSAVAFKINTNLLVMREGVGSTTIQAPSGVTLNGVDNGSCEISDQYSAASLTKRDTNAWVITGNITEVA